MIKSRSLMTSESGQGMTEYIIIVALIAIAAIGIVSLFGQQIQELFSSGGKALAGSGATTTKVDIQTKAYGMKDFGTSKR